MKRMIKSASIADEEALKQAQSIFKKAQSLLDALDNASEYTLEKYELHELHDRLLEDVPAIELELNTPDVAKKPKYEDMW